LKPSKKIEVINKKFTKVSQNSIVLFVFVGSLTVTSNQNEVKYEAIRNLNEIFFSLFYNPRKRTGKLVGSNSTGEVILTNLSGTRYPLLSEPSYFKIDLSLASGSEVLFNIHFCILEDGKCQPYPDEILVISISSAVGSLVFVACFGFFAFYCFLKKRRNLKRDPTTIEMRENNAGNQKPSKLISTFKSKNFDQ
jgi:hypothetical protein